MRVDKELVLQVAELARLDLTEEEVDLFGRQLQQIVEYVEKLKEIKEPAVPFSFENLLPLSLRPDVAEPSLGAEESLKNAPDRVQQFFKVPRIIP
ncbi:MAG TPA: Asp-tRNA(Asn)/Glu-tRNA(Gln) amidotransferase subunit GatC [Acidobacteriota bacterium]|nr:Asp-tRNA(Asn)/Glu-tRNA(Gln) amidotransferase subunit GatC [Acidobacteriota bacterium]